MFSPWGNPFSKPPAQTSLIRVALKSKMKAVGEQGQRLRSEVSTAMDNDDFGSGLLLNEPFDTGEKSGGQMGERFGKSQHDIEVIDTL